MSQHSLFDERKLTYFFYAILGCSLMLHLISIMGMNLIVEEAYYWNYAQHLDFGYLDHPPMVAFLIKLSTVLAGTSEFGVRAISLVCFTITCAFSYQLTEIIDKNSGPYALILVTILPFFFLHAQIMTPDVPLLACWSAAIYSLYRALILKQVHFFYVAGISIGLGLLSKYTIALVGFSALIYILITPSSRFWLKKKEPYLSAMLALLIFSPVIYWNATHQWVSFIFQSSRRLGSTTSTHLPHMLLLILFFLMPIGVYGLCQLIKKNSLVPAGPSLESRHFIRVFTLVPLTIFILFSINHSIKFNWIGPLFLALIPWLAALMGENPSRRLTWLKSSFFLLGCYALILLILYCNSSEIVHKKYLKDFIAWDKLTQQFNALAEHVEQENHISPTFVPLDLYHTASELAFYQAKLKTQGLINHIYPVAGSHIFGNNSLMYRYWSPSSDYGQKPLILISTDMASFDNPLLKRLILTRSPINHIGSISQVQGIENVPYYYQIVTLYEDDSA